MKVNAIIAEYNPFHNGHRFQIGESARKNGADYTIVIMSGNFVQRGNPALIDKYTRARMALLNGADLCLELPVFYSTSSAEYFATGAVALADQLGIVDHLCFGSEHGDRTLLTHIAHILSEEPSGFQNYLQAELRSGCSYPIARTNALLQYDPTLISNRNVLGSPNNILGIEYIKALNRRHSRITPFTVKRIGADYHDKRLGNFQCSALAIRYALRSGQSPEHIRAQLPDNVYTLLTDWATKNHFVCSEDFSIALLYKLIQEKSQGFTQYFDVSQELSDRIVKHLYDFRSYEQFCDLLKSKNMTFARISRCLLHILLNIKKEHIAQYRTMDYVPYARILGFRKGSEPLLHAIKAHASIPMISKLADAKSILSAQAAAMLEEEIRINEIYQGIASSKGGHPLISECSHPLVIV